MTTPVTTPTIVDAATAWLSSKPDVLALLGIVPGKLTPMLFAYRLWTPMEQTQSTACVVSSDAGWAGANQHNTLRFPRIDVEIWSDPIRVKGSERDPGEVIRRSERAFQVIDSHLHRPQGGSVMWGPLRTVSCTRLNEPVSYTVPDGDGMLRTLTSYAVVQG